MCGDCALEAACDELARGILGGLEGAQGTSQGLAGHKAGILYREARKHARRALSALTVARAELASRRVIREQFHRADALEAQEIAKGKKGSTLDP